MTIIYFCLHHLYLPDCYSMRFITLLNYPLIDWWCNVIFCLFPWWFDSRVLLQQFDTWNQWTRTRIDYCPCITRNQLTKCASHPSHTCRGVHPDTFIKKRFNIQLVLIATILFILFFYSQHIILETHLVWCLKSDLICLYLHHHLSVFLSNSCMVCSVKLKIG